MPHRAIRAALAASLVTSLLPAHEAAADGKLDAARAVYSLEAGGAAGLDGRLGGTLGARVGGEVQLAARVALGAAAEVGLAKWWAVGDDTPEDLIGTQLFGQIHVGIQLGPMLRLEPAVGGGAINLGGNLINGWLPAYSSTVAIVYGTLRAGIRSRIAIGDLEIAGQPARTYDPGTELHAFIGWQH